MNRALPAPPPVMGYTGANPVRAVQAMTGGVNRIGASSFQPLAAQPTPRVVPPPRPSAAQFNPLTNVGEFANPKTMVTFAPGPVHTPGDRLAGAVNDGVFPTAPGAAAIAPGPGFAGTPSATWSGPTGSSASGRIGGGGTLASPIMQSPGAASTSLSKPTTLADSLKAEANRMTSGVTSPILAAKSMSDGQYIAPSEGTPAASPFAIMDQGNVTQTRTAPALNAYSAADPNRALRTMRGY